MTLGGLALAVGILVDDATVAIENINQHLEQGKGLEQAILDGAQQIAIPTFVSTLCICIVFVPMFLLTGVARYLFVPLAEAVVFAMLASYFFSRTLVPTLAKYLLRGHEHDAQAAPGRWNLFGRMHAAFEARLRAHARGLSCPAGALPECADPVHRRGARGLHRVRGVAPVRRPRLLPHRGCRPVQAAPARQDRHAHRGDRAPLRSGRGEDPQRDPGRRAGDHHSTTSACRPAAPTCPTTTPAPSGRPTPTSSCR